MDALFAKLARQALLAIKVEDVARFLGKRLPLSYDTQVNSHLGRRHAGLRLKHSFGQASVKLYNRPGGILRMEMTTYDQNTASAGFQADTNLNTICNLVPGKMVSVALSSSAILAAN
jgi:hypothetical protein